MALIKSVLGLFGYYGPRGFAALIWEKLVAERHRYSTYIPKGAAPQFSHDRSAENPLPEYSGVKQSVLYLTHCFYPERSGGTERFVLNMAKGLHEGGHEVHILTGHMGRIEGGKLFGENILWKDYVYEGVPVTAFSYIHAPAGALYHRIAEHDPELEAFFSFLLSRMCPDIVHAAYPQPYAAVLRLCRDLGIRYVVTVTDLALCCTYVNMTDAKGKYCPGSCGGERCRVRCRRYGTGNFIKRYAAAQRLLEGAAYTAAPSGYVAGLLEKEFSGLTVRVVPHGIDAAFSPGKLRTKTRRFVFAGNFSALKGVRLLAEIFAGLEGDVTLDIYGWGDPFAVHKLQRLADKRIRLHGKADPSQMPNIFKNADCVVVPSVVPESYNFVSREALMCGCIVVVSGLGAMTEAVDEGKNGFVFQPANGEDFLEKMRLARDFDWSLYQKAEFPGKPAEINEYLRMYE